MAARIHRLIQKEGIRYREIAVITGDLSGYGYEIANRFQAEKIPYFMDNKKSILENVMVEFIRGALEIIRKDFDYESVFRFLKTGLVSDEQEKIDRLENYVVAMGIRGYKRWSQNWEGVCRGEGSQFKRNERIPPEDSVKAGESEEGHGRSGEDGSDHDGSGGGVPGGL